MKKAKNRPLWRFCIALVLLFPAWTLQADNLQTEYFQLYPTQSEGMTNEAAIDFSNFLKGEQMLEADIPILYAKPPEGGNPLGVPVGSGLILIVLLSTIYSGFFIMKRVKKVKNYALVFLMALLPCMGFAASPVITLTPEKGTCSGNAKIKVSATGGVAPYLYVLQGVSDPLVSRPQQPSNVFENLSPGSYEISVYDDGDNRTEPVTGVVTVETSYVELNLKSVSAGKDPAELCLENGVFTMNIEAGLFPFTYSIESGPAGFTIPPAFSTNNTTYTYRNLPAGQYVFRVSDNCGTSKATLLVTIDSDGAPLGSGIKVFDADAVTNANSPNCNTIGFTISNVKLINNLNKDVSTSYNSSRFQIRYEYPANSGSFGAWGSTTIPYIAGQNSYRLQVKDYCSGATMVFSPKTYTVTTVEDFIATITTTNICTAPYQLNITNNSTFNCHPLTIKLYKKSDPGTILFTTQTPGGSTTRSFTYQSIPVLDPSTVYSIEIKSPSGFTKTIDYTSPDLIRDFTATLTIGGAYQTYCPSTGAYYILKVTNNSTLNCHPLTILMYEKDNPAVVILNTQTAANTTATVYTYQPLTLVAGRKYIVKVTDPSGFFEEIEVTPGTIPVYTLLSANVSISSGSQAGCEATNPVARITTNQNDNSTITYTLYEGTGMTKQILAPVTISEAGFVNLWSNLPYGTYTVDINYGCRSEQKTLPFAGANPPAKILYATDTYAASTIMCGKFDIQTLLQWKSTSNGALTAMSGADYFYIRTSLYKIVGNDTISVSAINMGPTQTYSGLDPGRYLVKHQFTKQSCYLQYFDFNLVSELTSPNIIASLSGGVACSGDQGTLHVEVIGGSGILQFRCKNFGDADTQYSSWQPGFDFPSKSIGKYTVQVKDECGTIKTQDVDIYSGSEQFLVIDLPVVNGFVCSGLQVTMKALPVGKVISYKWYKDNVLIDGANQNTYKIPNVGMEATGVYKVEIDNGFCILSSIASLTVLKTPDLPIFSLSNNEMCEQDGQNTISANVYFSSGVAPWTFKINGVSYTTSQSNNTYSLNASVGENTYTLTNVRDNSGNTCEAAGSIEAKLIVIPNKTTWTASAGTTEWNNMTNWSRGIPGACTYVTIPGGLSFYPEIQASDLATCDIIDFKHGGEVLNTHMLTYNQAKVDLTLKSNRWYMLSAPLRNMYSGDYFIDETFLPGKNPRLEPAVYMMKYQSVNPEKTDIAASKGNFSGTFNTLFEPLNPASGFTAWVDKDPDNTAVTFHFPKDSVNYKMHNYSGATIGNYSVSSNDRINRNRFIYETGNNEVPVGGAFGINVNNDQVGYDQIMVGNPFMSHLNFPAFQQANSAKIQNHYQIWGGNSFNPVIVLGGTPISATDADFGFISPMQSFIVRKAASSAITGNLSFDPTMTVTRPNSTGLRSAKSSLADVMKLSIYRNNELESGIAIIYNPWESNQFNPEKDVHTLLNTARTEPAVLYALVEGKATSIHTVGDLTEPLELGISTSKKGQLTLKTSDLSNFQPDVDLFLEDRLTGVTKNLRKESEYTFTNEIGNIQGRFFLKTSNTITGSDDIRNVLGGITIYPADNQIYVSSDIKDPIRQVEVYSIQGQLIYKKEQLNVNHFDFHLNTNFKLVIVKVLTNKNKATGKILVK